MLTYALIGCGRIAKNHIAAALAPTVTLGSTRNPPNEQGIRIAAVCDIVPERMDAMLALIPEDARGGVRKFADYREMLAAVKPDLCAIATESGKHAAIALDCIDAGASVIVEKPLALSLDDADEIIRRGEAKGVKVCVCHQNRFNKSVVRIRKALDDGRFGKLSHAAAHVRWNRDEGYYRQAPWRGTWADDGGCLMNQCIHNADLMLYFLGDIEEVFAYTRNAQHPYIEGEDLGLALLKAKSGALGLFEGTVNVYPRNLEETLYLFGENGTVKAGGASVNLIEEWRFADALDDPETVKEECRELPPNVYGFGHAHLYADMITAMPTGGKPLIDGREGRRALELVLAMYKSKKTALPVRLPMGGFGTRDMGEGDRLGTGSAAVLQTAAVCGMMVA
jgi:predicted dehydrogenase